MWIPGRLKVGQRVKGKFCVGTVVRVERGGYWVRFECNKPLDSCGKEHEGKGCSVFKRIGSIKALGAKLYLFGDS